MWPPVHITTRKEYPRGDTSLCSTTAAGNRPEPGNTYAARDETSDRLCNKNGRTPAVSNRLYICRGTRHKILTRASVYERLGQSACRYIQEIRSTIHAGPRLTVNSLTDHRTWYNLQANAKHVHKVNCDYHHSLSLINRTSFLLN
ncbi:hypothetical protein R3P38DRAFT_342595 [Favolaschia claudopus]|uniref:Uncharacterized protein n=1 Tax=Favolaschia claudopus TaxID=2862362 RepID=A0AAV9ZKG2_9AGAR